MVTKERSLILSQINFWNPKQENESFSIKSNPTPPLDYIINKNRMGDYCKIMQRFVQLSKLENQLSILFRSVQTRYKEDSKNAKWKSIFQMRHLIHFVFQSIQTFTSSITEEAFSLFTENLRNRNCSLIETAEYLEKYLEGISKKAFLKGKFSTLVDHLISQMFKMTCQIVDSVDEGHLSFDPTVFLALFREFRKLISDKKSSDICFQIMKASICMGLKI